MANRSGKFVISLDFELMWGMRDVVTTEVYGENLRGVQQVLPKLLEYFRKYEINATFAIVTLLFFKSKEELLNNLPTQKPQYEDPNFSPYGNYMLNHVGLDSNSDPYHYAPHLVQLIKDSPNQEIGTHTFSHFYCLEEGQTSVAFKEDLRAAIDVAKGWGIATKSIVFPRNQINTKYLEICADLGIRAYRSNENSWIYAARKSKDENLARRCFRLIDSYINLSGQHCYNDEYINNDKIVSIPSSRFLRPYSSSLRMLEGLRLRRIKKSMTYAAKNGLLYHLWWHPHNFGINQGENFLFLEKILAHYSFLKEKYAFTSVTMSDFAKLYQ